METPTPQPSRLKKIFRRTMFVLAVLITLGALVTAEEYWRGNHAWHHYKITMEAKGERFDAARLIPPKVPDDENFAACPYLAHAFAAPSESPGWTNIDSALRYVVNLPRRPGWSYGLSTDLTNWAAAFQNEPENSEPSEGHRQISLAERMRHRRPATTAVNSQIPIQAGAASEKMDTAQAAAVILDHLKVCEPVLAELRAASLRRYCRFNVPYEGWASLTASNAMISTMDHYTVTKGLYRVLSLRAEAELASSQSGQALEDVNLMFRLDDGLKDEPLLMSQLVRNACISVLLHPVAQGLAERHWSEPQLRALEERLGQTDLLASTDRSLYGERDICANPFFINFRFVGSSPMTVLGWNRLEQLSYNRAFQEIIVPRINLADREINPATGHVCDLAMSNYIGSPVSAIIYHHIIAGMMLPSLCSVSQKTAAAQTEVDLVTVACALERYHLAEGTYPDQLAALAPRFIATVSHDIINGQPLKYRRSANGKFVLYSVGWNGKDDGGVTVTKKDGTPDRLQGDWVLEYPD
jgi:hypothetical protein